MLFDKTDRTHEHDRGIQLFQVYSTDICQYYKRHPYTELWKDECWTCRYADFGIDSDNPSNTGTCRYKPLTQNGNIEVNHNEGSLREKAEHIDVIFSTDSFLDR